MVKKNAFIRMLSVAGITSMLLCAQVSFAQANQSLENRYPLVPYPQELTARSGSFTIDRHTVIVADSRIFANEIEQLQSLLKMKLKVTGVGTSKNFIQFKLDSTITHDEGYILDIDKNDILISAKNNVGIFRAVETIRQLLPNKIEGLTNYSNIGSWTVPDVYIKDFPIYEYRGMHLDVARHFFSFDYLEKFIDRLALYKFNKLHLHLTDDEAWRIEIKKYPKLTQEGAWRTFDAHDSACIVRAKATDDPDMEIDPSHIKIVNGKEMYGGFYTQKQMKEIVAYAAQRHIDIIPEIDMPGHSRMAIKLYPFLACTAGKETGQGFSVPMCPCNENTFTFAENVYSEIFKIFPYKYVHLGADEVNKESWAKSPECKEVMQKQHLKNVEELQSYFVRRMEKFFNAHGKKLIGWDEILEGGVTSSAIVMYWRSWVPDAPVIAAKQGNKVIMTPGNPLYFDAIPDQNSLMNVYHFNPIPKGLNKQQAANIIGAQANIWTEYIPTTNRLEFMVYPRMLALSEVLWTGKTDDASFLKRLKYQYKRMDALDIHYRLPDIAHLLQQNVFIHSDTLNLQSPMSGLAIHYTVDGSMPSMQSPILNKPIVITKSATYKIALFTEGGLRGQINTVKFDQQDLMPSIMVKRNYTGLNVAYYEGTYRAIAAMDKSTPARRWNEPDLNFSKEHINAGTFGLKFTGVITVPEDGVYSFYLTSDDGSILKIADKLVVDNDGLHSAQERNGQIALQKGSHFFEIDFIEGGGGYKLQLQYSMPNTNQKQNIPDTWFK